MSESNIVPVENINNINNLNPINIQNPNGKFNKQLNPLFPSPNPYTLKNNINNNIPIQSIQ